ncbi:MAG TPA: hypothetical protein VGO50_19810 [Pyrinomonadaceae bacterium]|jgi:hypothetical protein|nr:hypothetical protein [Pyrinomonadaceae bacterium]
MADPVNIQTSYTNDKAQKFAELYDKAFERVKSENEKLEQALSEDDLDLTQETLKEKVTGFADEIWKKMEVGISQFARLQDDLRAIEARVEQLLAEFTNAPASKVEPGPETPPSDPKEVQAAESGNVNYSQVAEQRKRIEVDQGVESKRLELDTLKNQLDEDLIKQILERMRQTINDKLRENYGTTLKITNAPGLAEIIDPLKMINTNAKESLEYMLNTMEGGCIGIAGSRGAGKSTLIQMCCGEKRTIEKINGTDVLAVYTTAPVQYESRDFILYLFSTVCQRVLGIDGTLYDDTKVPEIEGYSAPAMSSRTLQTVVDGIPTRLLRRIGTLLILVGLLVTAVMVAAETAGNSSPDKAAANTASAANTGGNVALGNESQPAPGNAVGNDQQAATPAATPARAASAAAVSFSASLLKVLEVKPLALFFWGGVLLLMAFVVQKFHDNLTFEKTNDFPTTYTDFLKASDKQKYEWRDRASAPTAESKLALWKRLVLWNYSNDIMSRERMLRADVRWFFETWQAEETNTSGHQKEAAKWITALKFQQSFTSGWSGALKLPVGVEGGMQRATTLSMKQMSNPEIVAAFVKFLKTISAERYRVIIGIDELDKMELEEDASTFLNEIKSIFGLANCFYLISVSENAMHKFDRRGMPFRDVFDSSFDSVVYVDYLDRKTARALIEKRLIGRPTPFIYLSYCLAGGLPRDLIRNFRNLVELNQKAQPNTEGRDIGELCREIIAVDIRRKTRAIISSAKKKEGLPEAGKFIEMIFDTENVQLKPPELLAATKKLLHWNCPAGAGSSAEEKADNVNRRELEKLSEELGSYLYFLTTILEFFRVGLSEATLRRAAYDGDLDLLAKARQLMSVNPTMVVATLSKLRVKWKFDVLKPRPASSGANEPSAPEPAAPSPTASGRKKNA